MIKSDIKLAFQDCEGLQPKGRIFSSTLELAIRDGIDSGAIKYCSGAYVPGKNIQPHTSARLESCQLSHEDTVSVCKIPEHILSVLRPLLDDRHYGSSIRRASTAVTLLIEAGIDINKGVFAGVKKDTSELRTLTVNTKTGYRTGIHLDSWDKMPLLKRYISSNRLCINLGPGDRYFVFSPYSIGNIYRNLSLNPNLDLKMSDFMRGAFDIIINSPVYWVKVKPGEAYIAPTENLLHDGSTWGIKCTNSHVTWRGFVNLKRIKTVSLKLS